MSEQQKWVSMIDKIIEKFVPILGAILFITGLGYLIYTSVWQGLSTEIRLGIGFFASFLIIGSGLSFSAKLKYFADIIIGAGVLLFYGTLIYGSRATEISGIVIPEQATLITAMITTILIAYFASLRQSSVILILGVLGAYLTPFVIGQNDVWASNISFNSYLIYFAMINAVIFFLGKEIDTKKIIPLNMAGLFFGTLTLYSLVYQGKNTDIAGFASSEVSVILMGILVVLTTLSLAISSKYFTEKTEESMISFGYFAPLAWFLLQLDSVEYSGEVGMLVKVLAYAVIAGVYFWTWNYLRPLGHTRYQHIWAYTGGVIAVVFGISNIFGAELTIYSSILISYLGLFFAIWNLFNAEKWERILTAIALTIFGSIASLSFIYGGLENNFFLGKTISALLSLLPAASLYFITKTQKNTPPSVMKYLASHSLIAGILMGLIVILELVQNIDAGFLFLILPGFIVILMAFFGEKTPENRLSHAKIGLILTSVGFFYTFFFLVSMIIPGMADQYGITTILNPHSRYSFDIYSQISIFENSETIKAIFAIISFFLGIKIFRKYQPNQNIFPIVTIAFASLLLFVNFILVVFFNEIGVAKETGGIRAIATTIWWILLAIGLLIIGIRNGKNYKNEKILGLTLLLLTIGKIGFYDLATMPMDRKIIVLMVVGGLIMMFSYFLQMKGYLKDSHETEKISENSEKNTSEK